MFHNQKHAEFCKDILHMTARRHGITILELAIMSDHIHMIVQIPADMSQSKAIQLFKGCSSYELFRTVPNFRLTYPRGQPVVKRKLQGFSRKNHSRECNQIRERPATEPGEIC